MNLVYYKFPDEATWLAAAESEGFRIENPDHDPDNPESQSHFLVAPGNGSVDVVGEIFFDNAVKDARGLITQMPTSKDGFHVNCILENPPEAWDEYLVVVSTPVRVFWGWPSEIPDLATLEEIAGV